MRIVEIQSLEHDSMPRGFSPTTKFLIVVMLFGSIAGAIWLTRVSGSTQVATTLKLSNGPGGLDSGLVGHWTFDGEDLDLSQVTAEARDRSGNGFHADWRQHASSTVPGRIGQALRLDGWNDYLFIDDQSNQLAAIDSDGDEVSLALWVYSENPILADADAFAGKYDANNNERQFRLQTSVDNTICWNVQQDPAVANNDHIMCDSEVIQKHRWYHVAGVFQGGQYMRLYVDGVLVEERIGDVPTTFTGTAEPFNIGASGNGATNVLQGVVDDVRLYDRPITADEVKHLHQLGATTKVATTPTPHGLSGSNSGLVGHWTFDGKNMPSGQVNDISGQGNNGSQSNMASSTAYVAGRMGQALQFDGSDDMVLLGATGALKFQTGSFSYGGWFQTNEDIDGKESLAWDSGSTDNYRITMDNAGAEEFTCQIDYATADASATWATTLNTGVWYHIMCVYDSTTDIVSLYVDGISRAVSSAGTGGRTVAAFGNQRLQVGSETETFWRGIADDVRVYSRTLSADEIEHLYQLGATTKIATTPSQPNSGTGLNSGLVGHWTFDGKNMPSGQVNDTSGQGNHGSQKNMSSSTAYATGPIGQALEFDGSDDGIVAGSGASIDLKFGSGATIALWVKPKSCGEGYEGVMVEKSDWDFTICASNAKRLRFFANFDGAANGEWNSGANSITLNQWQHVAVAYNSSSATNEPVLYVNGALSATTEIAEPVGAHVSDANDDLVIGAFNGGSQVFRGAIDDFRFYSRILSPDEIKQLYRMGQ